MQHHIVISLDPAIENFGYAVLQIHVDLTRWRLLDAGLVRYPLAVMDSGYDAAARRIHGELGGMIGQHSPRYLVFERFLNRGKFKQGMNEKVNVMIGMASTSALDLGGKIYSTTPATWKNEYHRLNPLPLKELYNRIRAEIRARLRAAGADTELVRKVNNNVPHVTDSVIMALIVMRRPLLGARRKTKWLSTSYLIKQIADLLLGKLSKSL